MLINDIPYKSAVCEERICHFKANDQKYTYTIDDDDEFTLYDKAIENINRAQKWETSGEHSEDKIKALYRKAAERLTKFEPSSFDHHFSTWAIAAMCYLKISDSKGLALYQKEIDASLPHLLSFMEELSKLLDDPNSFTEEEIGIFFQFFYLSPPVRGMKALCLFARDHENFTLIAKKERELMLKFLSRSLTVVKDQGHKDLEDLLETDEFKMMITWYYALNKSLADLIQESYPSYEKLIQSELETFMKQFPDEWRKEIKKHAALTISKLNSLNQACLERNISAILKKVDDSSFLMP